MSSAVHNLQKSISSGNQPLLQLLRETKLIAAKLNLEDVEQWVDLELNGYPPDAEPPDYRKITTHSLEIHNGYRGGWQFAGNLNFTFKAHQPIAEMENFSQGERIAFPVPKNFPIDDGLGSSFASDWPQRFTIAGSQFKRVIEAVKNELLEWAIELEKRGIKGENMDFDEKEKQSASNHVFNIQKFTGVLGNVTNSHVIVYDYSSIEQLLKDKDVPKQGRRELEDIMDELKTAPPKEKPSILRRGEAWIVEHKEFLGTAAEAVGKAIRAAASQ